MLTKPRNALMPLIVLLAVLSLTPTASAQNLDATAGKLDLASLDGIDSAASRTYAVDIGNLVERVTDETPASDEAENDSPLLMLAVVAEFDTADHAENAGDIIQDRLVDQLPADTTGITLEAIEIDDLGNRAWQVDGSRITPESSLAINGFVVQDSTWVSLTLAISDTDSAEDAARLLVEYTLRNRSDTAEAIYDVSGTSRGGIWAKLPADGDTLTTEDPLSGAQPIYDNQLVSPASPDEG